MSLNLRETVINLLSSKIEERYTAREIAEWILTEYPEECEKKIKRSKSITNNTELIQQIAAEISSRYAEFQKHYAEFKTTEERPRKYYWTEQSDQEAVESAESLHTEKTAVFKSARPLEIDLYPILSEYLWSEFRIYPKRIDEKKSSNTKGPQGNKWLYPDLVGMEDLTTNWHDEVKNIVGHYADKRAQLWSFEVKKLLNRSNLRESFFQAVSNSSWANFGYLVASEVEKKQGTMSELQMLSSLHGIGLIKLNLENPAESQILVPARERQEVDWAICDRITQENEDFLRFVQLVKQVLQTGEPRPLDWDIPKHLIE